METADLVTIGGDDVTETEEEILARTQRFEAKKRELEGYVEEYRYGPPLRFFGVKILGRVVPKNIQLSQNASK